MELTCYVFPDLLPWERACAEPILAALSKTASVHIEEVGEHHKGCLAKKKRPQGSVWILSRDWQGAISYLSASRFSGTVWVSVFDSSFTHKPLVSILMRKVFSGLSSNIHLLAHSPLALRFFREVAGISEDQVHQVPLAVPTILPAKRDEAKPFAIGSFGSLTSDSAFHSILLVAHYIFQRDASIQFRIFGIGPLYEHLGALVRELGLQSNVSITESVNFDEWNSLDALIYTPRKNDHFSELLVAGRLGIPVVSSDVPGADAYIQDGRTGFISAIHETKPMAELALRLKENPELRINIGRKFKETLEQNFSPLEIGPSYAGLFFGNRYTYKNFRRAA